MSISCYEQVRLNGIAEAAKCHASLLRGEPLGFVKRLATGRGDCAALMSHWRVNPDQGWQCRSTRQRALYRIEAFLAAPPAESCAYDPPTHPTLQSVIRIRGRKTLRRIRSNANS